MKTEHGDMAALSALRFAEDLTILKSGNSENEERKQICLNLNRLSFDIYMSLPGRYKKAICDYTMIDKNVCRNKASIKRLEEILLNPQIYSLDEQSHAQIIQLSNKFRGLEQSKLIAINLNITINSLLSQKKLVNLFHSANLM